MTDRDSGGPAARGATAPTRLPFQIVAHRGVPDGVPANTLPAFARAIDLGADALELDVRLTRDGVPVVCHYFYLDDTTTGRGPVCAHTFAQLAEIAVRDGGGAGLPIPALSDVLAACGGRIGLEIEIKGPEPEAAAAVATALGRFRSLWDSIEITSAEPALLRAVRERCPGLAADLLFPRSEAWMRPDAVAHLALHRARLAGARAVHLHPSQLHAEVVATVRAGGVEIHAWDVNDAPALDAVTAHGIPRICTDHYLQALRYRTLQVLQTARP